MGKMRGNFFIRDIQGISKVPLVGDLRDKVFTPGVHVSPTVLVSPPQARSLWSKPGFPVSLTCLDTFPKSSPDSAVEVRF